jgi:WD40 repeat protein
VLPGHKEPVNAIALSANGRVMATRSPGDFLRLWDTLAGKKLCQIEKPVDEKHRSPAVAVSPDGRTVAWANADDRTIRVVDVATGAEHHRLGPDSIYHFTFVADGKTLATTDGRSIRLWG